MDKFLSYVTKSKPQIALKHIYLDTRYISTWYFYTTNLVYIDISNIFTRIQDTVLKTCALLFTSHMFKFGSIIFSSQLCGTISEALALHPYVYMYVRAGWPHQPLSGTLDDQLPSMSGAHGLKDFLCSAHLLESFEGRIYTYGSVLKSKFVPQRTQEDGLYRKNPSNYELLTLRGVDRRVCLIRVGGVIPPS